ncbi:hypothetical protein MUO79_06655 [Candidatus Bathyarchaeota archaeon]|nr:hypothetical protein [Candidatus Bathyarchaeota archaeon]
MKHVNAEKIIDVNKLISEASSSEHKESYQTLDRDANFRIGVGARTVPQNNPSFFVEILIRLSSDSSELDLDVLEKCLVVLKAFRARGFKEVFQDDNCVSCEAQVSSADLLKEYEMAKTVVRSVFDR